MAITYKNPYMTPTDPYEHYREVGEPYEMKRLRGIQEEKGIPGVEEELKYYAPMARYYGGLTQYDKMLELLSPEGAFEEFGREEYGRVKRIGTAAMGQQAVQSGLYGAIGGAKTAGNIPLAYDELIGKPYLQRMDVERMERVLQALGGKAQFMAAREDYVTAPTYQAPKKKWYEDLLGGIGKGAGAEVGTAIGGAVGGPLGAMAGRAIGGLF